jgi:uncharacterized protein (TIGR02646 family)
MKRIVKGAEPEELSKWKEDNADVPQNLRYGSLHGNVTRAIRQQMLTEQGFICAYTMQRIQTADDCHLEHLVPQSQPPKSHDRDLEYTNMLACFPGTQLDPNRPPRDWSPQLPYGARHKDQTNIDENNFVSPLSDDVETRFLYDAIGFVHSSVNDPAASNSIEILKLNHGILRDLRRAAIDERVFETPLSATAAEKLAVSITTPDSAGIIPEFCVAISPVCIWYANTVRQNNTPNASV